MDGWMDGWVDVWVGGWVGKVVLRIAYTNQIVSENRTVWKLNCY